MDSRWQPFQATIVMAFEVVLGVGDSEAGLDSQGGFCLSQGQESARWTALYESFSTGRAAQVSTTKEFVNCDKAAIEGLLAQAIVLTSEPARATAFSITLASVTASN